MPPECHGQPAPRELRVLQRAFQTLATGGAGSATCLIAGDVERPAADRLAVYREAYFWRLHDVLAEQHAALRVVVGADAFVRLVRAYLDEHPPTGHDLAQAGARLPTFLAGFAATAARPQLAELARFEWLHLDLFVAADARPLTMAALQALPPAALPQTMLRPVPAFALFECEYDVAALHAEPTSPAVRAATRLVIWRKQLVVLHRRVDAEEWRALAQVARGTSIAELGERLAQDASIDDAAARLGAYVTRWLDGELLRVA